MYLSRSWRPSSTLVKNATQLSRTLAGGASVPKREPRRVPLAKDLGGISLESPKSVENKQKNYRPRPRDVGEGAQIVDQMLSVRLNRRLPTSSRTGAGPDRSHPVPRRSPPDQSSQQQRPQQRSGALAYRPKGTGAGSGMRTGAGARQGGKPGAKAGPRPQRRGPRLATPRSRAIDVEPDVPIPPAPIPSRVYDLTNLPTLNSPAPLVTVEAERKPSDILQHVREKIGGDYSQWMSKEDLQAAGKEDASPMTRAKLAMAFNSSVSPDERKKILGTAEMMLNRGRTVSVPAPS